MTAKSAPPTGFGSSSQKLESFAQRLHDYQDIVMGWIRGNLFELVVALGIAVLVYLALSWLKRFAAKKAWTSDHPGEIRTIVARTFARTSRFFRAMISIELVNGYTNAPPMLRATLHALFTIAAVIQIAIWLREIIIGFIERRANDSEHSRDTLSSAMTIIRLLVSFALFAIAGIFILDNLGVNVTGLVAGLGVGGIAIGLAAQGIFADLFAAIAVIFDKPFRRGDTISYDQTTARVERIGMKSTRLRALTGEEKIISNSKLLEKEITNGTLIHYRRTTHVLALVYWTPPEKLRALPAILQDVVEAHHGNFVRCVFTTFSPSSIDFQLVFDIQAPELDDLFHARHEIGLSIFEALLRENYKLAYPTQTAFTAAPDGTFIMPYAEAELPSQTTEKK